MPTYTVNHRYYAFSDGKHYGPYEAGTVIDLDPAEAQWVNRDSPGTLTEGVTAEVKAEPDSETVGAINRMHKGGRKRAGG
jgi:hypothetical protein